MRGYGYLGHLAEQKGGRGECQYCKEMVNNVSYHEANECSKRPHECICNNVNGKRSCIICGGNATNPFATQTTQESSTEVGLKIKCSSCGEPITRPGALVFSPPDENSLVKKFHLCQECFETVRDVIGYQFS